VSRRANQQRHRAESVSSECCTMVMPPASLGGGVQAECGGFDTFADRGRDGSI
jgi:hypothetical protein